MHTPILSILHRFTVFLARRSSHGQGRRASFCTHLDALNIIHGFVDMNSARP
jgi:hypothetical protein